MTSAHGTDTTDRGTEALRVALVNELRQMEVIRSDSVATAVGTVPREAFVPGEPLDSVYHPTKAIVTKRDSSGAALSSLSEAHIQATMLEQARIERGMRVLEIGTGGYNAALIAELVGSTGQVTSVDIDEEIVDRAQRCLTQAGYGQVDVVLADAEHDVKATAPFDRIVVTAAAWDIPPAWIEQLADDGTIVVPLRMRGLTRSIAFERQAAHLASRDYRLCGFVPMQGDGTHAERQIPLDGDRVVLRIDGGDQVQGSALQTALHGPRIERWSGVEIGGQESVDGLDLWMATATDEFGVITATPQAIESGIVARTARTGAKAIVAGGSFAYRALVRPVDGEDDRYELGVIGHGPDGERLADEYVDQLRVWDREHRDQQASITVHPAGTPTDALPAGRVLDKQHTRVVITW